MALGSFVWIPPKLRVGLCYLTHLGGLPSPWSRQDRGPAQRARGRYGQGRLPSPLDDQALCPAPTACPFRQRLGKKKEPLFQVGAVASSCLTMEGIDRLGEVLPPSPPAAPPALRVPSAAQARTGRPVTGSIICQSSQSKVHFPLFG